MTPVCFLDLDGVLVDFVSGALALHGKTLDPAEVRWDFMAQIGFAGVDAPRFWEPLGRAFWAGLGWTHEGRALLSEIERLFGENVAILTSPCETDGCIDGKRDWIKRHLPAYRRRLIVGSPKELLAAPGKILVDDHDGNEQAFAAKDGATILVPRPWNWRRDETDALGRFDVARVVHELMHARAQEVRRAG